MQYQPANEYNIERCDRPIHNHNHTISVQHHSLRFRPPLRFAQFPSLCLVVLSRVDRPSASSSSLLACVILILSLSFCFLASFSTTRGAPSLASTTLSKRGDAFNDTWAPSSAYTLYLRFELVAGLAREDDDDDDESLPPSMTLSCFSSHPPVA
jgi:hypothetical protein